jgi:hypothetical protein
MFNSLYLNNYFLNLMAVRAAIAGRRDHNCLYGKLHPYESLQCISSSARLSNGSVRSDKQLGIA